MQWLSWWLVFLVSALGLLVLLISLPLRVDLLYHRQDADDLLKINFTLWGLLRFGLEVPELEQRYSWVKPLFRVVWRSRLGSLSGSGQTTVEPLDAPLHKSLKKLKIFARRWPGIGRAFRYLLKRTVIRHFSWQTRLGTGDAAETGILAGICWAVSSTFLTWLVHRVKELSKRPELSVVPLFNTPGFGLDIHCIFEFRVGHIIIAGATAMGTIRQRRG